MARSPKKGRPLSKDDIKAKAERAAKRSKGETVEAEDVTGVMNPPESSMGRPTKYRSEYATQARKLCAMGATDYEMADFFGVDTVTVWRWRNEHDDFCKATVVGKQTCDDRVVRSLYQRAVGYSYNSEKLFCYEGAVTRADVVEHCPPDVNAARLWLMNRNGNDWKEKQETTHKTDEAFLGLWKAMSQGKPAK